MTEDDSASYPHSNIGFLSFGRNVMRGVSKRGPAVNGTVSNDDLYQRLESLDISERLVLIRKLGRELTSEDFHSFIDALVDSLTGGTLDVTGWNRLAIKAAIMVCSERDLPVSFRYGERTISPISFPKDGALLEMFVDSIITGKWG